MEVTISHIENNSSELLCMYCNCHLNEVHVKALVNAISEHVLHLYSCPECPNITFEFCNEKDLLVLNHYLMKG